MLQKCDNYKEEFPSMPILNIKSLLNVCFLVPSRPLNRPSDWRMCLGKHHMNSSMDVPSVEECYKVDRIIKHEGFVYEQDKNDITNDIALVHLVKPVNMTREISPICLPRPGAVMPPGRPCFVTGWGDEKGGEVIGCISVSQKTDRWMMWMMWCLYLLLLFKVTWSPKWLRSSTRLSSPLLTLRHAVNRHTGGTPSDPPWSVLGTNPRTS